MGFKFYSQNGAFEYMHSFQLCILLLLTVLRSILNLSRGCLARHCLSLFLNDFLKEGNLQCNSQTLRKK